MNKSVNVYKTHPKAALAWLDNNLPIVILMTLLLDMQTL